MQVTYTYQVAFWNGRYNVLSDKVFATLAAASEYLGSPRNGCIHKIRSVGE